jgi:1-acyl-sn-glycerol-3-phosphate acyltransferase
MLAIAQKIQGSAMESSLDLAREEPDARILLAAVSEVLGDLGAPTGPISLEADFERDLGLASLERAELLARVERAFSITLGDDAYAQAHTAAALLCAVTAALAENGGGARRAVLEVPRRSWGPGSAPARRGPEGARTLVEMARRRADTDGGRPHLCLVQEDGSESSLSFAGLWERALAVAAGLGEQGLRRGHRVALLLPTGEDFFVAFLGVLAAGGVPVPLDPPLRMDGLGPYLERQTRLLANAEARALLTDSTLQPVGRLLRYRQASLPKLAVVASLAALPPGIPVRVEADDLALIQHTSGSTGDSRSVALRHGQLMASMRAIGAALRFGPTDVAVSWLPLCHDMGPIGAWLSCYLHGLKVVVLSPPQFPRHPESWLWAFHRHRGTVAAAPNFAYELCCREIGDAVIDGLDLSSWRSAMNVSEPVRPETVERFCRRFAPYGFRRQAMTPVYGLAETAEPLTFPPCDRPPRLDRVARETFLQAGRAEPATSGPALTFVSCGSPVADHAVGVVDRDRPEDVLPERHEGRILFRGPSTLQGTVRQPGGAAQVRQGEWIDTGDLGYLADGELFVTGRLEDLVIKGGRKVYPQDIEAAAGSVPGVRAGGVAAFDAPDPTSGEAIVVLAEAREAPAAADLSRRIGAAVQEAIGVPADRVVLLPPGTLPRTSSGKLHRRREIRDLFLAGRLTTRPRPTRLETGRLAARAFPRRALAAWREGRSRSYDAYAKVAGGTVLAVGFSLAALLCRREESTRRWVCRTLRCAARLTGLTPRLRGGPLPANAAVVVSNHTSNLDAFMLMMALDRPLTFTPKVEMFSWPLIGLLTRRLANLPVDRSTHEARLRAYAAAEAALRAGRTLHFFPECTTSTMNGLLPFRLGAFRLASDHGLPVVPVVIRGTREVLRADQGRLRWASVEVEILPPLVPSDAHPFRAASQLRDAARDALAAAVDEPLLDIISAELQVDCLPRRA